MDHEGGSKPCQQDKLYWYPYDLMGQAMRREASRKRAENKKALCDFMHMYCVSTVLLRTSVVVATVFLSCIGGVYLIVCSKLCSKLRCL